MNVSTMSDIIRSALRSAFASGIMPKNQRHARESGHPICFFIFHNPAKASLVATSRDHHGSTHSRTGIVP